MKSRLSALIEHAAVAGDDLADVLQADLAFDQRLGQVAKRPGDPADDADHNTGTDAERQPEQRMQIRLAATAPSNPPIAPSTVFLG